MVEFSSEEILGIVRWTLLSRLNEALTEQALYKEVHLQDNSKEFLEVNIRVDLTELVETSLVRDIRVQCDDQMLCKVSVVFEDCRMDVAGGIKGNEAYVERFAAWTELT